VSADRKLSRTVVKQLTSPGKSRSLQSSCRSPDTSSPSRRSPLSALERKASVRRTEELPDRRPQLDSSTAWLHRREALRYGVLVSLSTGQPGFTLVLGSILQGQSFSTRDWRASRLASSASRRTAWMSQRDFAAVNRSLDLVDDFVLLAEEVLELRMLFHSLEVSPVDQHTPRISVVESSQV
jgi:hypothetical protein